MDIYLDNAATSPLCAAAKSAMTAALEVYGNPSSTHCVGIEAKKLLDASRRTLATAFGCDIQKGIFTGSGSEGNNQAILSAVRMRSHAPKRIITDDSEHPSVSETLAELEKSGYEIIRISTKGGALDIGRLNYALEGGAALVSIMRANNETGAVYDIPAVRSAIDNSKSRALLHCDNVQGFLKTANVAKYCDFMSVSAHKVGGPKGVGALYTAANILPFINGGGQEGGRRSGTENTVGIAGFAAAVADWTGDTRRNARIRALRDDCVRELTEKLGNAISVHEPPERVGGMMSVALDVTLGGKKAGSEVMLNWLSARRICVSAGSACHASRTDGRVLSAFGLKYDEIASTIRVSFGAQNTEDDKNAFISAVCELVKG